MTTATIKSVVLDDVSRASITDVVSSDRAVQGKTKKMTDALVARGVKSSMLEKVSKKTDANPHKELHFGINQAIIAGFPIEWQSLLSKDTSTLSQQDKDTKRYAQQQVGSWFGKIQRALIAFENPNKASAPRVTRTSQQRIIDALNDAIEVAQKDEELDFDITKFITTLKSAIAMVK
jgi:hypothetical protein